MFWAKTDDGFIVMHSPIRPDRERLMFWEALETYCRNSVGNLTEITAYEFMRKAYHLDVVDDEARDGLLQLFEAFPRVRDAVIAFLTEKEAEAWMKAFANYFVGETDEVDWRSTEVLPEDYYAL